MREKLLQAATVTFLLELLVGIMSLSANLDRVSNRPSQQPNYQLGNAVNLWPALDRKFPTPLASNMTNPFKLK